MTASVAKMPELKRRISLKRRMESWGFGLLVIVIAMFCLLPFLWLFITSLKLPVNLYKRDPDLLPIPGTFDNYGNVFRAQNFGENIWNSIIAATGATIACLILGLFAGYALGRLEFRGRGFLLGLVLAVSMFPGIAIIAPLYLFFTDLKLTNQIPALWLPYTTFNLPLTVWLLAAFFRDLPAELEEAAEVDGATPFKAFWMVIMPLASPGIATAAILIFINAWNEFLFARTLMSTNKTAPVAIQGFAGVTQEAVPWGDISTGAVIVTVPLLLLVAIFQRRIISGLTSGAVKG
jgi:multiple sugar transport system permease protein